MSKLQIAAMLACLVSGPALASTITETVAFSGNSHLGWVIYGAGFDTSLGTLTGVTLTASGTYQPDISLPSYNPVNTSSVLSLYETPATSTLQSPIIVFAGNFSLHQVGDQLFNSPEAFSATISISPQDLALYSGTGTHGLLSFDALSNPTTYGAWGTYPLGFYDVSSFSGNLVLAYSYTVPEPASIGLLAVAGLLTMLLAGHRPTHQKPV